VRTLSSTPHMGIHAVLRLSRGARTVLILGIVVVAGCWVLLANATPSAAATASFTPYGNVVSISPTSDDEGYATITSEGKVSAYGDAAFASGQAGPGTVVAIVQAHNPSVGFWMATAEGGVFSIGVPFYGSMGSTPLDAPVVGMATTPDNLGYWLVAADGGIFSFGDASFYGSRGGKSLNASIVGMAPTSDGKGYWLVAADGGIFSFGDASFYGSMGGKSLNAPIVGMAASSLGGYWLVGADGGIFSFAEAPFLGSMGASRLNAPISGIAATSDGRGYWLVGEDNGIFTFGDAGFFGPP
jgi:hypothetical protein